MAVQGNLVDISLSSLISINCNEMNQARLVVKHRDQEGTLFFDKGEIVHMTLGSQEGDDVIFELLTWEDGAFELTQNINAPKRSVQTSWTQLLLEGLRQIDERSLTHSDGIDDSEKKQQEAERASAVGMVKDFTRINGVDGALVTSRYGDAIGFEKMDNPAATAALGAFIGRRAEELGVLLNAGSLEQITLTGNNWKTIIFPLEKKLMTLSIDPTVTLSTTADAIQVTKRRHRKDKK